MEAQIDQAEESNPEPESEQATFVVGQTSGTNLVSFAFIFCCMFYVLRVLELST
jgi:hypothetical protein